MTFAMLVTLATRYSLVALFFPFSALDKILNFHGAVRQAKESVPGEVLPAVMILVGLAVEVLMPLGLLTGTMDRLAAFVLAGYCGVTALLWKRFWAAGDFWAGGRGREQFWDFLKNFALAGGFLMVTFGLGAGEVSTFFHDPLSSTHPYDPGAARH